MAGIGRARRRGIARLLTLCAVLLGLFLMHGAPATAAEGCHGAMTATSPTPHRHATAAMTSTVPATMTTVTTPPAMAHPDVPQASSGAMCVSTPARDRNPLPMGGALMAVVAVLVAGFLSNRPVSLGGSRRRGPPPPGGRSLLLTVCIART
ncbi:hypothetical protein G3I60_08720 [Streptomyces sp. SID13666]|uniref:hypothetical protein n=1 Tax=Streptomyces TaxID=1883 RepID=UPI001105DD1E|nr:MULTISPECIES: hypothetical protein [Streptomyces]MCZ4101651.1 hypothetical protein [Streptomyces sp. H39-C1]NEA54234.1 hypothetical protein [Streptomyces sp. SID13666]NEA70329.1 hypothetical protein [Streptomyces sp. SID13588]QNA76415.1 hypothetical protein C8250_035175 [Streptomyces sp. So13.3]